MTTAGTERLRIDSTGVVDIESAKLEIAGAAGSANQVVQTNGSGTISWGTAGITVTCLATTTDLTATCNFVQICRPTGNITNIYGKECS